MPALVPSIGNIGRNDYMWRSYRPCSSVEDSLSVFIPKGFDSAPAKLINAVGRNGNLDIAKFRDFFTGGTMSIEALRAIRYRSDVLGASISEVDVKGVFNAYCQQLDDKNIQYHYNADFSPFDNQFQGKSNCQGRAKGFMQIMAMLGVPKEQLNFVTIGSAGDETKKVCRKNVADIVDNNIYVRPQANAADYASNAIRIKLEGGSLKVRRTLRKPFANHYCVLLDIPSLSFKYWDPLTNHGYRNGFSDFFTSYSKDERLKTAELKCFVNPDKREERIYFLPHRSSVLDNQSRLNSILNTSTYGVVEGKLAEMSSEKPQVAFMVDSADWSGQLGGNHPPIVEALTGKKKSLQ